MTFGIAMIPGTFPTYAVHRAIVDALPESGDQWTREKINDLYYLYKDAVESGQPVYKTGQTGAANYMSKNSNYSDADIRVFLFVLYRLAENGDITQKWWNIPQQEKRSIIPNMPGKKLEKTVGQVTGAVKWGSIAIVIGIATYFLWPYLKRRRT